MALNIKNAAVERLATEAAELAGESKTQAIRVALQDRVQKLRIHQSPKQARERALEILHRIRKESPKGDFGRRLSKKEREAILGFGPGGV
jgi:antitoxin VapB